MRMRRAGRCVAHEKHRKAGESRGHAEDGCLTPRMNCAGHRAICGAARRTSRRQFDAIVLRHRLSNHAASMLTRSTSSVFTPNANSFSFSASAWPSTRSIGGAPSLVASLWLLCGFFYSSGRERTRCNEQALIGMTNHRAAKITNLAGRNRGRSRYHGLHDCFATASRSAPTTVDYYGGDPTDREQNR